MPILLSAHRAWVLPLLLAACSSGEGPGDETPTSPTQSETTPTPRSTDPPTPSSPIPTEPPSSPTPPPVPAWSWCPGHETYVGDAAWQNRLRVAPDALLCLDVDEYRTLEEELEVKQMVSIAPGEYPLPHLSGTYTTTLPSCMMLDEQGSHPSFAREGTMTVGVYPDDGYTDYYYEHVQPLTGPAGEPFNLRLRFRFGVPTGEPAPEVVIGSDFLPQDYEPHELVLEVARCPEECRYHEGLIFYSCAFGNVAPDIHHLTFDGGELHLELRVGTSPADTEPAAFTRAWGTLDGIDFEQTSYWRLVYNPEHHHFVRDFAVLFDEPIDGACGIKAEGVEAYETGERARLTLVDCALQELEAREVTAESIELP